MQYDMSRTTLFEVSWEVCNKVGGINAVVSSKALQAVERFGDNYYLLGPDLPRNDDFEETNEHGWDLLRQTMAMRNLRCRFGRWNIPGRPKVILVSFKDRYTQSQLLYELWNRYGVDSMSGGWDYVEPVMFSTACGEVIAAAYQTLVEPVDGPAVAQFHEWMCGAGLLAVKRLAPNVGTIFTTHATMLGRSMAGSGCDIYKQMGQINPAREAAAYNITAKCSMETVAAREADCFTTVSQITADEAAAFLGRRPDVVTPNGLDLRVIPDYSRDRRVPEKQRAEILGAAGRLLRRELPAQTRLLLISGRYEFHNKGIDVFLDALAGVNRDLRQSETHVLAVCAVMGGHSGVNQDAVSGDPGRRPEGGEWWISSHHVYDRPHDPILNTCRRLGLDNRPENHVQVIFVPALLDGRDGFLNMPYEDVLAACDLGVFPSWYEPWGYTPQESAARAVPTVTTDLSGFGIWARTVKQSGGECGVDIIARRQQTYEDTVAALQARISTYVAYPPEEIATRRAAVRLLADKCSWEQFFPHYLEAFRQALDKAAERGAMQSAPIASESLSRILAGSTSATPTLHGFTAVAKLPEEIGRLRELAYNLWWCWRSEAWELFAALDPSAWDACGHNPVHMIEKADNARLEELARDAMYLSRYRETMAAFDAYMAEQPQTSADIFPERPIAYFSTEYGLNECLPIYSGGLGVLSGDHLKSASDLNLPLVGVGLLYKNGYFRQQIDKDGRQIALYPENDFSTLPLEQVKNKIGEPLEVELDLPGRHLYAWVWRVQVGRIPLYLLDTDTPKNTPEDRRITERLYVADRDYRIRQEILLGMGGVRLLELLNLQPSVYHMNEGHSAFLIFERIRTLMMERGLSFDAAGEVVRGSNLFTTHTPVDAGNERFSLELMERYFSDYARSLNISWQDFLRTGRLPGNDRGVFEMTVLALNYSFKANGVSRLHGHVSRHMWHGAWKGVPTSEVPIGYVTNGVHMPSYVGPALKVLLDRFLGQDWVTLPPHSPTWEKVENLPDNQLWAARQHQKGLLLDRIRAGLGDMFKKFAIGRSHQKEIMNRLDPSTLVIGFARRFAPYKRANLLFADPDRLESILNDAERPVILVFSGKAHPADTQGIDIMQEVIRRSHEPRFMGRIFFLEDYSLAVSRFMVQGCDVWLNTPRRPYEASGTSGQKVPVNGCLNLSVSDGWWCEGYNGRNGWTIGPVVTQTLPSNEQSDYADAESLYTLLEETVVPLYYDRNVDGIPHRWLELVKNSLRTLTPCFSSHRMVREYFEDYYQPAAARYKELSIDDAAPARHLAEWKKDVAGRFSSLRIEQIRVEGVADNVLPCFRPLGVTASIVPGSMKAEELLVQLVAGPSDGSDFPARPDVVQLEYVRTTGDGRLIYTGSYTPRHNGHHAYGVRVMPVTEGLASPLDTLLVAWG